jgi:hypothetical protein
MPKQYITKYDGFKAPALFELDGGGPPGQARR